ncbi:alpha/beta hydrolase [Rhizobium mayense]|uniref:Alpha/beta hydrolase n=1 Tax=Rhizobium mayense TaxID=1312184 RepID=A0ABT7K5V9_9HYPH|nr:alpha/beta hydrolase [Rhizobium mayense]MDL2403886.1 alpha/beta hydrolase [Rhizobium mayense]
MTISHEETTPPSARLDPDMREVLAELKRLGARPLAELTVEEARAQPGPADAANALELKRGFDRTAELEVDAQDGVISSPNGSIPITIYRPKLARTALPIILYFHSGGFVIGSVRTSDLTTRRLALNGEAIVVSVDYRKAPEHPIPAAHDDAWAAYLWLLDQVESLGGDKTRIVVMGESAGGNLAANVAIRAVVVRVDPPACQILLYPVAGHNMDTLSYRENADSAPLGKRAMAWFFRHAFAGPGATNDPRISLADRDDLAGLPPTLLITANLDPLRSEGQALAASLRGAGVPVNALNIEGLGHEFFCMSKLVPGAKFAMETVLAAIAS